MITISVTVKGGTAPLPIKVFIDNLNDNQYDQKITKDRSFSENFDLPSGKYMIVVSGMNPQGGTTDISVTGAFTVGPRPDSSTTAYKTLYSVLFYGEI